MQPHIVAGRRLQECGEKCEKWLRWQHAVWETCCSNTTCLFLIQADIKKHTSLESQPLWEDYFLHNASGWLKGEGRPEGPRERKEWRRKRWWDPSLLPFYMHADHFHLCLSVHRLKWCIVKLYTFHQSPAHRKLKQACDWMLRNNELPIKGHNALLCTKEALQRHYSTLLPCSFRFSAARNWNKLTLNNNLFNIHKKYVNIYKVVYNTLSYADISVFIEV